MWIYSIAFWVIYGYDCRIIDSFPPMEDSWEHTCQMRIGTVVVSLRGCIRSREAVALLQRRLNVLPGIVGQMRITVIRRRSQVLLLLASSR